MSNITIKPNDSGIGEIKITGPNTNDTRYQLLPDVSGNVVVSDGSLLTVSHSASEVKFGGRTEITGVPKGLHKWEIVSSNTTLTVNRNYFANTRGQSDLTLTLPASANIGDTIQVIDNEGFSSSNNIFIANGTSTQTIDGGVRKLTLTTNRESVKLFYTGTGWVSKQQETERETGVRGQVSGYVSGGDQQPAADLTEIQKFPFATDSNTTDVGELAVGVTQASGQSSTTHGYSSGGFQPPLSPTGKTNTIQKFPFAVDTNATDSADLVRSHRFMSPSHSETFGYNQGGYGNPGDGSQNQVDKFPFANDSNAIDVGDLDRNRHNQSTSPTSSESFGYAQAGGGSPGNNWFDNILRVDFATDANSVDVGDVTVARQNLTGHSSPTHGYGAGGNIPPPLQGTNIIDKFPFASESNSVDVGDLAQETAQSGSGQSSSQSGYVSGARNNPPSAPDNTFVDTIQKFPFASDTNGSEVGSLAGPRNAASGQQH